MTGPRTSPDQPPPVMSPALRRKVAAALGIKDGQVGDLPFLPVVVVANLDGTPGPIDTAMPGDSDPYDIISIDLTNARTAPEKVYPENTPIGQVWVDAVSAAATLNLQIGQGRPSLTVATLGQSYRFVKPLRGGLWITNVAQAGLTIRLGVSLGQATTFGVL